MKWFNIVRDRLRALRQRDRVIGEIDREMRSHVELQVEANIRAGMSPEEARAQAMRSFGNVNRALDAAYDVKGGGFLETLAQDIRYGVRMSPDQVEHLFEPFSSTTGGTGLGLSIVYQIIRDHGGTINVRSRVGQGTTITVELPVAAQNGDGAADQQN